MSQGLTFSDVKSAIRAHKLKGLIFVGSAIFFILVLFPYGDLAGLVTAQVAKLTGNQVYLQFEDLGLGLNPSPAIRIYDVKIETPTIPSLKADQITVAPSIPALLTFKKGFSLDAEGFLKGEASINYSETKTKEGNPGQAISLEIEDLALSELKELVENIPGSQSRYSLLAMPVSLNGIGQMDASVIIDPSFKEQPEGELSLNIKSFDIPPSTVPTAIGPLSLPKIQLSNIKLSGRLSNGDFLINEGAFGGDKDPIKGTIKGKMAVKVEKRGINIKPIFGAYEFNVSIDLNRSAQSDFGLFFSFIDDRYKKATNTGSSYQFKASGLRWGRPPKFSAPTR